MKNIILFLLFVIIYNVVQANNCLTVKKVVTEANIEGINPKRFTLGVKQITEEILSEKYNICEENGDSVSVVVKSIEAPTYGVSIGPFDFKRKVTVVTTEITVKGIKYVGVGEASTDVKSTFIELQDENLPFEKSAFSGALKKSLQDAISKI
jgi:hypothetical protein